jgi:hypothetical protein
LKVGRLAIERRPQSLSNIAALSSGYPQSSDESDHTPPSVPMALIQSMCFSVPLDALRGCGLG